jgi:hypothetical protein
MLRGPDINRLPEWDRTEWDAVEETDPDADTLYAPTPGYVTWLIVAVGLLSASIAIAFHLIYA